MTEDRIKRMNVLYHKSKEEKGLNNAEKEEQKELRNEYMTSIRASLRGQLDNISLEEKDGSITNLGEKYGKKYQNEQPES